MNTYELSEIVEQLPSSKLNWASADTCPSHPDVKSLPELLSNPVGFPGLEQAVLSDDTVCIPVDIGVPMAEQIASEVVRKLIDSVGVSADRVCILLPQGVGENQVTLFIKAMETTGCSLVDIQVHDGANQEQQGYLGPSQSGEPIMLNARLVHADFVLPIVRANLMDRVDQIHPLYPYFSDIESQKRFFKLNHRSRVSLNQEVLRWLGACFQVVVAAQNRFDGKSETVCGELFAGEIHAANNKAAEFVESSLVSGIQAGYDLVVAKLRPHLGLTFEEVGILLENLAEICNSKGTIVLVANEAGSLPTPIDGTAKESEVEQKIQESGRQFFLLGRPPSWKSSILPLIGDLTELRRLSEQHESVWLSPDFINEVGLLRITDNVESIPGGVE